ncbi:MAG TPA: hypothetical protein DC049_04990, partial [Spirochaetia bacterium]|nr:hypothetical protein [Spirochaetia bacterium]
MIHFLPEPKHTCYSGAFIKSINGFTADKIFSRRIIHSAELCCTPGKKGLMLVLEHNPALARNDEYRLEFSSSRVKIISAGEHGAYYAIMTLRQLLESDGIPAEGYIEDWADLEMRILHLDLKRVGWNFEYLMNLPRRIASMKINYLLVEYEDKIKFDFCKIIPAASAFSKDQIRAFAAEAEAHCLEIIPLVQCLGHWEYILKHQKYAGLREYPEDVSMGCPLKPDTFQLFKSMAGEVLELHPNSRFFHIGADETTLLGTCSACSDFKTENSISRLYSDYVNKVFDYIQKENSKTALFWGDMLLHYPEMAEQFLRSAIVVDWSYNPENLREEKIRFRPIRKGALIDVNTYLQEAPPELRKDFDSCVNADAKTGTFDSLPYGGWFAKKGFKVLGASLIRRVFNVLTHAENAVQKNFTG